MPLLCIAGHRHWSEHAGGVELQLRYLGEALAAGGWEVVHLCHSLTGKYGQELEAPGRLIYWIPLYPNGFCVPRQQVETLLAELNPDVLYQRGWGILQESGVVLDFALRRKLPYVFALSSDLTVQKFLPTTYTFIRHRHPRWRSWLLLPYALWSDVQLHKTLRKAPYLFTQHKGQQELLRRRYGRESLVVPTLHPELHRPARKEPTPLVVWIHNYRPHAQLGLALKIAASYERSGIQFFFVTGSTRPEQLRELHRWKRLPSNVRLFGALSPEEAQELLERAWVLLHTAFYEGFPNTFVQAWLRETPVVSLWVDPGGVLRREGIGICADGNTARLQQALESFLDNPEHRATVGLRAREYAEKQHGLRHNCPRLQQLFNGLAQRKPISELCL